MSRCKIEWCTTRNRLNINLFLLRCIVENNGVGVVVMTAVRGLEVYLLATFVVALAVLTAAVDMLLLVGVTRKSNNRVTAYPHKIYSQHCCYFNCPLHATLNPLNQSALLEFCNPRSCVSHGSIHFNTVVLDQDICNIGYLELLALQFVPQ